jgi:hypothetical protein
MPNYNGDGLSISWRCLCCRFSVVPLVSHLPGGTRGREAGAELAWVRRPRASPPSGAPSWGPIRASPATKSGLAAAAAAAGQRQRQRRAAGADPRTHTRIRVRYTRNKLWHMHYRARAWAWAGPRPGLPPAVLVPCAAACCLLLAQCTASCLFVRAPQQEGGPSDQVGAGASSLPRNTERLPLSTFHSGACIR